MIDAIKDYIFPKRFSILAYVCVIIHFHCGVLLSAITTAVRLGETEKFSCRVDTNFATHKTYVEKTCFSLYDDTYNSPVRFYAFVVLNFGFVVLVSVIYSLAVGNRIDETERYVAGRDEFQTSGKKAGDEPGGKTFYVFYFYFIHLVARLMLGILFTILQHFVLYPSGFDSQFSCVSPGIKQAEHNITAAQNASINTESSHVTCTNSAAQDKQFWGTFVSVCNVIFAIITLVELIYPIGYRFLCFNIQSNPLAWSCDSQFITEYFLRKQYFPSEIDKFTGVDNCTLSSSDIYKQKVLKDSLIDINYGLNISLDDMFIDVVIKTGQAPHKFAKGMTRHEIYDVHLMLSFNSIRLKETKDLFCPNMDTNGIFPRTILALGRPGIGKTVLTRKILQDWASNDVDEFYQDKIIFLFKFRCFNFSGFQNLTLKKFLHFGTELNEDQFESIFEEIIHNSQKIVLIFDGLDELCSNLKEFKNYVDQSKAYPNDPDIPMSAMFLFIKIIFGNLLEEATVLVTSRPTASDVYTELKFDRRVEIIGFTADKIEKYVEQFCANHEQEDLKAKIWSYINSSSEIKNLCYIPVCTFIVCVTLSKCLTDPANHNSLPTTLTELYQAAVVCFYKNHDRGESKDCYKKVMKELQWLAFKCMENEQLIFDDEMVNEQWKESGLLHCLPAPVFQIQTQVCFIHLTVQEFLAAEYIVETKEPEDIKKFISSHVEHGKWHLVLQFLAGLLGRKVKMFDQYRSCVLAFTEHLSYEIEDESIVFKCDAKDVTQILVMKCLRETGDEDIAKEAAATSALKDVTCIQVCSSPLLGPSEYAAMVFVWKHLVLLTSLTYRIPAELYCFVEVMKLLQQRCIQKLSFSATALTKGDLFPQHVLSVLTDAECRIDHEHSKLTHLTFRDFVITDACVSTLTEFLCKNAHRICLQELDLSQSKMSNSNITSCGISTFCEVLGHDVFKMLTYLNLDWNGLGDDRIRILCEALSREKHRLQRLSISECSLTTESIFALVEVLSDKHCEITDLELAGNEIGDEVVGMLCDVLREEQCKLVVLDIGKCSLTDKCVPYLTEALGDEKCKLTDLTLSKNIIGDKSADTLFAVLKLEQCSLTKLSLAYCFLTEKCMAVLCEVLAHEHCGLINLDLSGNKIGDEAMHMLCCALRKEQCKLTELSVACCSLTDECFPSFCEVLRDKRCRLTRLNLRDNNFTNKYLSLLSDTLQHEHSSLQFLDIWSRYFTGEGKRFLKDVENFEHCKARRLKIDVVYRGRRKYKYEIVY